LLSAPAPQALKNQAKKKIGRRAALRRTLSSFDRAGVIDGAARTTIPKRHGRSKFDGAPIASLLFETALRTKNCKLTFWNIILFTGDY
jgi:hypothetical protein